MLTFALIFCQDGPTILEVLTLTHFLHSYTVFTNGTQSGYQGLRTSRVDNKELPIYDASFFIRPPA